MEFPQNRHLGPTLEAQAPAKANARHIREYRVSAKLYNP